MGVFLACAGPRGHTLLDRKRYLTETLDGGAEPTAYSGAAPDTPFATKPQLARARDAGLPVAWVTGDTVSSHSRALHNWLEDQETCTTC